MLSSNQNDQRIYSIRIVRTNIEYLKKYYPDIPIDDVLAYMKLSQAELADDGYWCTQEQVDRYQKIVYELTKNPEIARESGRYVVSSSAYRPIRQYVFGFISLATAYSLGQKINSKVTKGSTFSVRSLKQNKMEVISKPNPGVSEKQYQCFNRIGHIEALAAAYTGKYATVEETECYHKGGRMCRYEVSWIEPNFLKLRKWRNYVLIYGFILCGILSFFVKHPFNSFLWLSLLALIFTLNEVSRHFEKNIYKSQLSEQAITADLLMRESNMRHNESVLVREIGQTISSSLDIDTLLEIVMNILKDRLEYDRGVVLLANNDKTRLVYKAGFGLTPEQMDFFKNNDFYLDRPHSKGPFIVSFREKKPIFIDKTDKIFSDLSERSKVLLDLSGSTSFICVPIVFEDESLGVLSVDRAKSTSQIKSIDIDILMGIAPQIAISIRNSKSYEMYRDLVESANSIIVRIDSKGVIKFANRYALNFYGYPEQEFIGRQIMGFVVPYIDNEGRDLHQAIKRFLENPDKYKTCRTENILHNGQHVWISWSSKPIKDKHGNMVEVLCVGNDVTELKIAEEDKMALEEQLVRAQKMEAIGTLAGGVAHDLNNILSGITSYPELLLMELPDNSPLRKSVQVIKKSGEKAAAMVQDLLTLARRGVDVTNVVDLNSVVREYMESPEFGKLCEYHPHIQFEVSLEDKLRNVLGSEIHLSKTLMNLVSNAAEAMPKGGTVSIKTEMKYLTEPIKGYDTVLQGEYSVLSVSDTGIGISEKDITMIFEPFFSKKTMGRSGTGLGMTVVWSTVKDHKGYINVESSEGKGTKFYLYFPITKQIIKEKEEKDSIAEYAGTEHILVVDDAEDQLELSSNVLTKLGYQVDTASSGEEAVEFVKHNPTDLLILDMIMDPGIDGLETYKRILVEHDSQKAIVVSGYSESEHVKEIMRLGAGAYIKKPYNIFALAKAVRKELDK